MNKDGSLAAVRAALGRLEVGEPVTHGPLTLAPVTGLSAGPDYLIGADAIAAGLLRLEEHGGGVVERIIAHCDAELPVLLLDGEHLAGAKQDRILTTGVLLAPRSRTVLPVSCVEQGRWSLRSAAFAPAANHAPARLRGVQAQHGTVRARAGAERRAAQSEVWDTVYELYVAPTGPSPTGALSDAYTARHEDIHDLIAAFDAPAGDQCGVVAAIAGTPVVADIFDRPETLAALWERLLGGYATDAVLAGRKGRAVTPGSLRAFLRPPRDGFVHPGTGIEEHTVLTGRVLASCITWQDHIVHAAYFRREPGGGALQGPRYRARAVASEAMHVY